MKYLSQHRNLASNILSILSICLVAMVLLYFLVTATPSSISTAIPEKLCGELMRQPGEHVKIDSPDRVLVWVGDGSEHYCTAFKHDGRWVVSGQ